MTTTTHHPPKQAEKGRVPSYLWAKPISEGQRDNLAWSFALMCYHGYVSFDEACQAAEHLHRQMEQPDRNYYHLELIIEKVHRVYSKPISAHQVEEDDITPGRLVQMMRTIPQVVGSRLEQALAWLAAGFIPIPVAPGKKAPPLIKEWQHWRPTEDDIRKWWTAVPDANIALLTGAPGTFIVLDFDNWEDYESHPWRGKWEAETVVVKTARGVHVWFGVEEPVRARRYTDIDLKAEGGYVFAPGSQHPSGAVYTRVDQGGDHILVAVEGAPRYCLSAVDAISGEGHFTIDKESMYRSYPVGLLESIRDVIPDTREKWSECGIMALDYIDKNRHVAYKKQYCGDKPHSPDARARAHGWVEENKERLLGYSQPVAIEPLLQNASLLEDRKAIRTMALKLRRLLKKEGFVGDGFEVPIRPGQNGPQWCHYIVGDGNGVKNIQALARKAGFDICKVETLRTPLEFIKALIHAAYTGVQLWGDPVIWHLWHDERKGKTVIRGVDDAKRSGGGGKQKRPAPVCPHCGEPMHATMKRTPLDEVLRMVERGEARWINGMIVENAPSPNGHDPPAQGVFGDL